jgi:hypothetical protein
MPLSSSTLGGHSAGCGSLKSSKDIGWMRCNTPPIAFQPSTKQVLMCTTNAATHSKNTSAQPVDSQLKASRAQDILFQKAVIGNCF